MMKMARRALGRFTSLRVRLALFLSLAILPIGIIAVVQTSSVLRDARELEQQAILSRTAQTASIESNLFRRSHGAATALGYTALRLGPDTEACRAVMTDFVDAEPMFVFAGFTSIDGVMRCSSTGETLEMSDQQDWRRFLDQPRENITVNLDGAASGQSVIIATVPIFDSETNALLGAASVSLPHSLTDTVLAAQVEQVDLALMDENGAILSAGTGIGDIAAFEALGVLPAAMELTRSGTTFDVELPDGTTQLAALVPLVDNQVFVLGLWNASVQDYDGSVLGIFAPAFPILIWCIALVVAILSLDRLVLRHLRRLRHRMATFSIEDPGLSFAKLEDPPDELRDISDTYNRMIERMLADRAELSETLAEKEVLLREVHHRVKNNLQLIASILNMQMRSVPDGDARRVLRRVQDRVMSLSTIYKTLYTGTTMASVRADKVLAEVVESAFSVGIPQGRGIKTSMQIDAVELDPDQAVPLALLANETVTNAIKYLGRPADGPARIEVRLTEGANREVTLEIENTLGVSVQDDLAADGTGLGSRLVEAFVSQLGGTSDVVKDEASFLFRIIFTAFVPDAEPEDDDASDPALPTRMSA